MHCRGKVEDMVEEEEEEEEAMAAVAEAMVAVEVAMAILVAVVMEDRAVQREAMGLAASEN